MISTVGKRRYVDGNGVLPILQAGEYGCQSGVWYACPPDHPNLLINLANHEVEEHGDGTITVSPSIVVTNHKETWHGYLKQGIWEQA